MKKIVLFFAFILSINAYSQTNNLIAHFPFNGNINDSTGNYNTGIFHGNLNFVNDTAGNSNSAVFFDGNSFLEIPFFQSFGDSDIFAVSMWVYCLDILQSNRQKFLTFGYKSPSPSPSSDNLTIELFNTGVNRLFLETGNSGFAMVRNNNGCDTNFSVPENKWNHIMVIHSSPGFDVNSFRFYVNNQICSLPNMIDWLYNPHTLPFPTFPSLAIGVTNNPLVGNVFYYGYLDDVKIYNQVDTSQALNMMMVQNLFNHPPGYNYSNVSEEQQNNILIYPNPSQEYFSIKSVNNSEKTCQIFNINGQQVFYKIFNNELYVKNTFGAGVYNLIIKENNKIFNKKITIF